MYASLGGVQLGGETLIGLTLRYDLTPIPSTLEADIRTSDPELDSRLVDGAIINAGYWGDGYKIIKVEPVKNQGAVQGDYAVQTKHITAILESVHKVAYRQQRAVIRERATMGEIYRACGSTVPIGSDFRLERFTCFCGNIPTFGIAQAFSEESAVPVYTGQKLSFVRLQDLFAQDAKISLPADTTEGTESQFLERNELPWAYSLNADGTVLLSDRRTPRASVFMPRTDARRMANMDKCLIVRKRIQTDIAPSYVAGDIFEIAGVKHVVVTAAHVYENGDTGFNQTSRFWLGVISK